MKDQPDHPPGFDTRTLLIPVAMVLVLVLAWFFTRPPAPAAPPPARPVVELDRTNLTRWHNLWCELGQTNPFTGVLVERYPGGRTMSRSMVCNGLLNGLSQGWFTNGQLQISEYYRTNVSDGVRTKWYPNGHKLSEATIVGGQIEGTFRHWHIDGTLAEEIPMRGGREQGLGRAYYNDGFLKEEVEVRDGKVVNKQTWRDGERKGL